MVNSLSYIYFTTILKKRKNNRNIHREDSQEEALCLSAGFLSNQFRDKHLPLLPTTNPLHLTAPPMALREGCDYQNLVALRGSSTGPRHMIAQVPH